ncbi:PDDEXK nuclease domain-containing protein [Pseudomonas guariconensis]|uniref:PDDEXK nuclease domain-containing protein n=1 Tax=Pseudomonas TaxID=286 RepID=UPI001CE4AFC8|nr:MULTISPECIES: PDDEXK nuclease domain-containing protein [Pseudomonas]MCO7635280.1 PDDEXK nuclease domain-containing protein [Pseudomonas sp. S 311-6]MCO7513661.1 PDDEXK nuclease domain-containing protein [Pseudomonas putida]MCO7563624.1 PDDEXK nuclease domain-containing protein [Pseudomonas mosselii]MCO7595469.1 PDDEXK nuclease domain-containing protein [Pseudomonas guariconensis]MCO7603938.1 PDDEXK nuclease domain-containing protein [Pseudomonas guariconensis]
MPDTPISLTSPPEGYSDWLADLKTRIHNAQQRASLAVNHELISLYWHLGRGIIERQKAQRWGAKVIERLAYDLKTAFPSMKGFSRANLMYMRAFADAWPDEAIVQQVVGQLPWGHNLVLLSKLKSPEQRLAYAQRARQHAWSRATLQLHIESRLLEREGNAITNFSTRLPSSGTDLARQTLKDPYLFDFLNIAQEASEREIEAALVEHITQFLLELGAGFAFVGRQVHLEVGGDDFYIDLLFYHLKLRCYVVIELKTDKFKPEHLGQLSFYLTAVDLQVKTEQDSPTIGLLLCKGKNKVVAEYALRDKAQPIGVAEYQLIESLPEELQTSLPSIEQIERELAGH